MSQKTPIMKIEGISSIICVDMTMIDFIKYVKETSIIEVHMTSKNVASIEVIDEQLFKNLYVTWQNFYYSRNASFGEVI